MAQVPVDKGDSTLALLSEGYDFIANRCARYRTDVFETRLMLRRVFCASGTEAAEIFYQPDRFTRRRAMPPSALKLLQDKGSVELLSGEAHRHRKQLFMSLMTPERIAELAELVAADWQAQIAAWQGMDTVVLHYAMQGVLCRAVCRWSGIELTPAQAAERTREFAAMIDGAGAVGPRNWRAMGLRRRSERWAQEIIEALRAGRRQAPEDSAAHVIALYRELNGSLMDAKAAAVELINVLRPTVAVARFVTFAALALHEHPQCREAVSGGDDDAIENFVQEVRRFYPFFPLIGGRVQAEFEWRGHHFEQGEWMLLDLYGTNHDSRTWNEPGQFLPERFAGWQPNAFNFIPQGGGDHYRDHRCPGEWITIELMKTATRMLTNAMRYDVPEQDLRVDLTRLPAIPESRFVISHVRHA
ncbi:MAG TPA: cytochrome P450 [Gammaproteobacteria bacterium]|nr:cytochrome P450 [Gammaproteobacteria bacterium]